MNITNSIKALPEEVYSLVFLKAAIVASACSAGEARFLCPAPSCYENGGGHPRGVAACGSALGVALGISCAPKLQGHFLASSLLQASGEPDHSLNQTSDLAAEERSPEQDSENEHKE
jgi:hypothetical protein